MRNAMPLLCITVVLTGAVIEPTARIMVLVVLLTTVIGVMFSSDVRLGMLLSLPWLPRRLVDYCARREDGFQVVIDHRKVSPSVLRELAFTNPNSPEAHYICSHPACPTDAMEWIATHGTHLTRLNMARDRSTPPEILDLLAGQGDEKVCAAVASNPSASDSTRFAAGLAL